MQFLPELLAPLLLTPLAAFLLRPLIMVAVRIAVAAITFFVVGGIVLALIGLFWIGSQLSGAPHVTTPSVHPTTAASTAPARSGTQ